MANDRLLYKGTWQVIISKKFLLSSGLTIQARGIFSILKSFASPDKPSVFPSLNYLASITGLNIETVSKYLNELIGKGYVQKTQLRTAEGVFFHNVYTLIEEPDAVSAKSTETENSVDGNSRSKKSHVTTKFSSDSVEVRLSELLLQLLREKNAKYRQPNIQNWARQIDLMIRIDKRTPNEIEEMIRFAQGHSFWHKNIECTQKLREKYDRLYLEMKSVRLKESEPKNSEPEISDYLTNGGDQSFTKKLLEERRNERKS